MPGIDRLFKDAALFLAESLVLIHIYNALGEMVSTSVCSADTSTGGGQIRIDVSVLPPGLYFVRVGGEFYKFVKL